MHCPFCEHAETKVIDSRLAGHGHTRIGFVNGGTEYNFSRLREGGFLAGEEQLREDLAGLYGSVNGYEGRPTQSQIDYTDKTAAEDLEVDPEIIISGIDELKMMEDNLMKPKSLPG